MSNTIKTREIKSDIRNGYNWGEYEGKYGKYDYTIQFTTHGTFTNGDILVYFNDGEYHASVVISADDFMRMNKAEFLKRCNEIIFYNSIENESEEN